MRTKIQYQETDGTLRNLDVDAVLREGFTGISEVTENPVEGRASVTDHIRDKSRTLTLEFVVTNTPTRVPQTQNQGTTGSFRKDPDTGGVVLLFNGTFDRVRDVFDELELARINRWLFTVETAQREYGELALEQVQTTRDATTGDAAVFTLTLRRITFAETRAAAVPRLRRQRPVVSQGAQPIRPPRDSVAFSARERAGDFLSRFFR